MEKVNKPTYLITLKTEVRLHYSPTILHLLAEEKAVSGLRASSPGRSDGRAGEGRRACNYVSGISIPPLIPLWLPVD